MTVNCIKSLQENNIGVEYSVIVVDNASPDNSGQELYRYYQNESNIHVVIADKNLGFAKGNNLGYSYAKRKCKANFIVVVNNDVIFNDDWRFGEIQEIYNRTHAYIIGPDIVSKDGIHQSPIRRQPMTDKKKVKRMIRNRTIYIFYFKLKNKFNFFKKFMLLEKILEKEGQKYTDEKAWAEERKGAVLHGACLIFTPLFIGKEDEAFDPRTFMYGEEDLLSQKARKKGYEIIYSPDIHILHLEEQATKSSYKGIEKRIFQYTNMRKGYELLLEELES